MVGEAHSLVKIKKKWRNKKKGDSKSEHANTGECWCLLKYVWKLWRLRALLTLRLLLAYRSDAIFFPNWRRRANFGGLFKTDMSKEDCFRCLFICYFYSSFIYYREGFFLWLSFVVNVLGKSE